MKSVRITIINSPQLIQQTDKKIKPEIRFLPLSYIHMIDHQISLTWTSISVEVKQKAILKNISGYCHPGTSLAIMGPSGSGKTTLLATLAKIIDSSLDISGEMRANRSEYTADQFHNFGSFVYQNNLLCQVLTVRQTLQFTAKLKLKNQTEVPHRVSQLINDFHLQKCQNTYVGGNIIKGISSGEMKRVCIAVEMVSKPSLLILDQPTSGLDSHMAYKVVQILTKLAKQEGRTIIFSIHQPSYRIFSKLDRLLVLDKGQSIYQGPASSILSYMLSLNIVVPAKTTISDYFMLEISEYKARAENHITKFTSVAYREKLNNQIVKELTDTESNCGNGYSILEVTNSLCRQFQILFLRQVSLFKRNPMKLGRAILFNSVLGTLMIGALFYGAISDGRPVDGQIIGQKELINYFIKAQGTSFMGVISILMTGLFSVALVFPTEREIFAKEISSKTYQALPYYLSKLVIEAVSLIITAIIFCSGVYWLLGYTYQFIHFLQFVLVLCCSTLVGNAIGFWTGTLFRNKEESTAMAPAITLPLMMFAGLYNKLESIPKWIAWMQYISPFRFGLHALLICQFQDEKYYVQSQSGASNLFDYKKQFGINMSFAENVGMLLANAALYYVMAFFFLKALYSKIRT